MTEDELKKDLPEQFTPVVEKHCKGVEAFLTEEPVKMVLENRIARVPLIVGYNSAEGLLTLADQLAKSSFTNNHTRYLVPREIAMQVSRKKMQKYGDRIKKFYFGDKDISNETVEDIVNFQTDVLFSYDSHRFVQFYSATNSPIYMYKFDLVSNLNAVKIDLGLAHMKGAAHADDLFYLFYNDYSKTLYEQKAELRDIVLRLTKLWTDFATFGNPTPGSRSQTKWLPYTRTGKEYLNIGTPYKMGYYAERNRVEFWDTLYCDARVPCMESVVHL